MNIIKKIESKNCRAIVLENIIEFYKGKAKKPKIYRYYDLQTALSFLDKQIKNYEDVKEKAKVERQQRNEAAKKRTKELLNEVKKRSIF